MPKVRKVSAHIAARWPVEREGAPLPQAEVLRLINQLPDRSGISRIDSGGTYGWYARVYPRGEKSRGKLFSDASYEGAAVALQAAVEWRDLERAKLPPPPPPQPRIWRVDNRYHQRGHIAKRGTSQKYFSDAVYGGPSGSAEAARAWASSAE